MRKVSFKLHYVLSQLFFFAYLLGENPQRNRNEGMHTWFSESATVFPLLILPYLQGSCPTPRWIMDRLPNGQKGVAGLFSLEGSGGREIS